MRDSRKTILQKKRLQALLTKYPKNSYWPPSLFYPAPEKSESNHTNRDTPDPPRQHHRRHLGWINNLHRQTIRQWRRRSHRRITRHLRRKLSLHRPQSVPTERFQSRLRFPNRTDHHIPLPTRLRQPRKSRLQDRISLRPHHMGPPSRTGCDPQSAHTNPAQHPTHTHLPPRTVRVQGPAQATLHTRRPDQTITQRIPAESHPWRRSRRSRRHHITIRRTINRRRSRSFSRNIFHNNLLHLRSRNRQDGRNPSLPSSDKTVDDLGHDNRVPVQRDRHLGLLQHRPSRRHDHRLGGWNLLRVLRLLLDQ